MGTGGALFGYGTYIHTYMHVVALAVPPNNNNKFRCSARLNPFLNYHQVVPSIRYVYTLHLLCELTAGCVFVYAVCVRVCDCAQILA